MPRTNLSKNRVGLLTAAFLCLGFALAAAYASASGEPPVPDAGVDLTIDEDTLTTFSGTATDQEADALVFSWLFPPAQIRVGASVDFAFPDPGTFTVFLFVSDGTSNESDSIGVEVLDITDPTIVIADGPALTADEDTAFALDGSLSFDNVAITQFEWTVFDTDTTHNYPTASTSYTWAQPGTYLVSLKAWDNAGNMGQGSATVTVMDITPPVATFALATPFNEDTVQELDGTDSTDNVGIVAFWWSIGESGGPATVLGAFAEHTWEQPGTYDVTLFAQDGAGNVGEHTVAVTVLDVTAPTPVINVLATFDEDTLQAMDGLDSYDNVGVVSYSWAVGWAGGSDAFTGDSILYTWATPGVFVVQLTAADAAGNTGSAQRSVTVRDVTPPTAAFSVAARFKVATLQTLDGTLSTDNLAIDEYTWTFLDGTTPVELVGSAPTYTWTVPGDYLVTLTVADAAGNSDTLSRSVTALENVPPVASIHMNAAFAEDSAQSLDGGFSTDNVGVVSWLWTIEDAGFSASRVGELASYTWTTPGLYTVTLTVADAAENVDTTSVQVAVLDVTAPVAAFSLPPSVGNIELALDGSASTDNVGVVAWEWTLADTGGDVVLAGDMVTHTWLAPGSFLVKLLVLDAAGNSGVKALTLTVVDTTAPAAVAGPDRRVNEDTTVTFDAAGSTDNDPAFPAGATFTWTFDDAGARTLVGAVATWVFQTPGTFTLTLEVLDAAGNLGTDTLSVVVDDVTPPTAVFTLPYTAVEDSAVVLDGSASTDNVGVAQWAWTIERAGLTDTRSGSSVAFTFETPGLYTVTLRVTDAAGNSAQNSVQLLVLDITAPSALAGPDFTLDEDASASFDATGSTDNSLDFATTAMFTWFFNEGGAQRSLAGATATYTFATPGTYPVTLLAVDGSGNYAMDLLVVTVLDVTPPTAVAVGGPTHQAEEDARVTFDASPSTDNDPLFGATGTFVWQIGGTEDVTLFGRAVTYVFANPGPFTVLLVVRDLAGNEASFPIEIVVADVTPPRAAIAAPSEAPEDLPVALEGASSSDNVGVVEWRWTVEDLSGPHDLEGVSTEYTWATPGLYMVTLTVEDAAGATATTFVLVRVADTTAPVGTVTFDASIDEGQRAGFSSAAFTDNDLAFADTRTDLWAFDEFGVWVELSGAEASYLFARSGTFTVNLEVSDAAGNAYRTAFDVVVVDTTVPWITVFSPEPGALLAERSVVVTGHFEPGALLYINGLAIDNLGSFAERVTLVEGDNTLAFEVRDAAGNRVTQSVAVRVDSLPPAVEVTAPAAGAVTREDTVRIEGALDDATPVTLTVDGRTVRQWPDGSFWIEVDLVEGANFVTFVAVDAAGHRTSLVFSAVRDATPPLVMARVDGADLKDGRLTTSANAVDLLGTAEPGTTLTLWYEHGGGVRHSVPVAVEGDGSFRAPVTLVPGDVTWFTLESRDASGNGESVTYSVAQVTEPVPLVSAEVAWAGGLAAAVAAVALGALLLRARRSKGEGTPRADERGPEE